MQTGTESKNSRIVIEMKWGDTSLGMHEVSPEDGFWIGEPTGTQRCDFVVPREVLGVTRWCVVSRDPSGRLVLSAPPGGTVRLSGKEGGTQVTLQQGDRGEMRIGPLCFEVAQHAHDRAFSRALRRGRDWRAIAIVLASVTAHAAVLGYAAWWTPTLAQNDEMPKDQIFLMQQYLQASAEREMEQREEEQVCDKNADSKLGGTGTRAKGDEGSMGLPNTRSSSNRYGVSQPDAHIGRNEALREAAEFGMIGLVNAGGNGDPNAPTTPWGRDDSLGDDPISARGNMWGDSTGRAGIGLSGLGEGGGGRGEGIGLGTIGTLGHGQGLGSGHGRLGGSHRTAPPTIVMGTPTTSPLAIVAPAPAAVQETPIDPNGRFATTYRPGRGHLAAFESAVARGILPPAARELVSDIGASYAPVLAAPTGKALAFENRMERSLLPPSGGTTHLRVALRSSPEVPAGRPHLSVHLVLDASGSMQGDSITRAKEAAQSLVRKLAPTDDFSLVAFSNQANVLVPDGPVGANRTRIRSAIDGVQADGGTNIEQGLRKGYAEAASAQIPGDAVKVVLLLSDGRANAGMTGHDLLSGLSLEAFQAGVQTSTFGLGADYDGELMSSIASDGAGAYYYLRDAEQIGPALTAEVDRRLDPAATAVEVRIRLASDVQLLRVYGSRRLGEHEAARVRVAEQAADRQAEKRFGIRQDRQDDPQGGMRFFMPAFARDDSHAVLVKLALPPGTSERRVAMMELRYKDRVSGKNVFEEVPVRVGYASSDAESAHTADQSMARTIQGFLAGETLMAAAHRIELQDPDGAAALLAEREQILRQAATSLGDSSFVTDAQRLARLRAQLGPSGIRREPQALAMLLEAAGRSHLQ